MLFAVDAFYSKSIVILGALDIMKIIIILLPLWKMNILPPRNDTEKKHQPK